MKTHDSPIPRFQISNAVRLYLQGKDEGRSNESVSSLSDDERMSDKIVIVFSPHPDDETFGCGGTVAKKLSEGFEVSIVLMTDGRHAYSKKFGITVNPKPEELMKTREEEVRRAAKILGVKKENLIFLNFEDGTLEKREDEAEKLVVEILKDRPPTEVYFTRDKDFHPDHRATNRIIKNSIRKANLHVRHYEYSISNKYGRLGRLLELSHNLTRQNMLKNDISPFLPLKEEAVKQFTSQISITSSKQKTPVVEDFKRFLKKTETFLV